MGTLNKIINKIVFYFLLSMAHPLLAVANEGMPHALRNTPHFTLLDAKAYRNTVKQSRQKAAALVRELRHYRQQSKDVQMAFIVHQLLNIPYLYSHAMGEGDWQPASLVYSPGAVHIQQQPVYRFDGFNCQTFVQIAMALLYSHHLQEFEKNYIKISYGANRDARGEMVHYYNRNHFIDGDFNPINQRNGWLMDVTSKGPFAAYAKTTSARITRQQWFMQHQKQVAENVQVLDPKFGPDMVKRFTTVYSHLPFPHFAAEQISIDYLPKEKLVLKQADGTFKPNVFLFSHIPTPAVVEIVRDIRKWSMNGINMKDIIGSELTVSHVGIIYKQNFHAGDLIYHKTICDYAPNHALLGAKEPAFSCSVVPVYCQKPSCHELMFAHATTAYPMNFVWYRKANGEERCAKKQETAEHIQSQQEVSCNRVVSLPLFTYLTEQQYGYYWNMDLPSLLGIHIEQLL